MADNDSNGGASPAPAPVAADNASPNNNGAQDYQEDVRERSPVDTRRDGDERAGGEDTMMDRERSPAYGRQEERRDDRREESRRDDRERSPRRKPPPPPPGRDREAQVSNVLGCFGLSIRTRDIDLEDEFNRYGHVESAVIVYDQRSERSRGFGFVTMRTPEEAAVCIEKLNGIELHGRNIRVAYSLTTKPHASTPGEYMGFKSDRPDERGPPPPRRFDDRRYDDRRGGGGGGGYGGGFNNRYDDRRGGGGPPRYDDRDRRGGGGGYGGGGYDDRRRDRDYDDRRGGHPSSSRYDDRDREPRRERYDDRYASTQAAPMAAPAAYEDRYAARRDDSPRRSERSRY